MEHVSNEEIRDNVLILNVNMKNLSSTVADGFKKFQESIENLYEKTSSLERDCISQEQLQSMGDSIKRELSKVQEQEDCTKMKVSKLQTVNGYQDTSIEKLQKSLDENKVIQQEMERVQIVLNTNLSNLIKLLKVLALPIVAIAITLVYNLIIGAQILVTP